MRRFLLLLTVILLGFTIWSLWMTSEKTDQKKQIDQAEGTAAETLVGGDFILTDQNGQKAGTADFRGRIMLVFFGYTRCPDECPATVGMLTRAMELLGDKANQVVPVFISVDPEHDTPVVLKDFLSNFDKRFVGLTGTSEQIKQVAEKYKVYYAKSSPNGQVTFDAKNPDYSVDHSAFIYMMGKDGKFIRVFPYEATDQEIARAVQHALE